MNAFCIDSYKFFLVPVATLLRCHAGFLRWDAEDDLALTFENCADSIDRIIADLEANIAKTNDVLDYEIHVRAPILTTKEQSS